MCGRPGQSSSGVARRPWRGCGASRRGSPRTAAAPSVHRFLLRCDGLCETSRCTLRRRGYTAICTFSFTRALRPGAGRHQPAVDVDLAGVDARAPRRASRSARTRPSRRARRRPRARRCPLRTVRATSVRSSRLTAGGHGSRSESSRSAAARLPGSRRSSRATVSTTWPARVPRSTVRNATSRGPERVARQLDDGVARRRAVEMRCVARRPDLSPRARRVARARSRSSARGRRGRPPPPAAVDSIPVSFSGPTPAEASAFATVPASPKRQVGSTSSRSSDLRKRTADSASGNSHARPYPSS